MQQAKDPDADLDALSREIAAISVSPPIYAEWMKALGIVLFTIGFSVNVQGTWQGVGSAALTALAVGAIVMLGDRIPRVSVTEPFVAAIAVSLIVLLLVDPATVDGGAILLMVPALFFFIPGDVLSASMYQLAAGRITVGATQFVSRSSSSTSVWYSVRCSPGRKGPSSSARPQHPSSPPSFRGWDG